MFLAVIAGWITGRTVRNSAMPDSVKQQRWDARHAPRTTRTATAHTGFARLVLIALAVFITVDLLVHAVS